MLVAIDEGIIDDQLSALKVKTEGHLSNSLAEQNLTNSVLLSWLAKQKKEPSTASSGNFSSQRAILYREPIKLVDAGTRNLCRDPFLSLPCFIRAFLLRKL